MKRTMHVICEKADAYTFEDMKKICKSLYPKHNYSAFTYAQTGTEPRQYGLKWNLTDDEYKTVMDSYNDSKDSFFCEHLGTMVDVAKKQEVRENLREGESPIWKRVNEFQTKYLESVIADLDAKLVNANPVDSVLVRIAKNLVEYAKDFSNSGSAITYLSEITFDSDIRQDVINRIENGAITELIGDLLLDDENYEESDGDYSIDVMFAGNYVPSWDGWYEN